MRFYNEILGSYFPSFFMVKINTKSRLDEALSSSDAITLIHEYVHFLDDISTTFGLNNFCRTVDQLKAIVNVIHRSDQPVQIPLSRSIFNISYRENVELFNKVNGVRPAKLQKGDISIQWHANQDYISRELPTT